MRFLFLLFILSVAPGAALAVGQPAVTPVAKAPLPNEDVKDFSFKFVPIPIYATSPNEGDTVGFMPVVMVVDKKKERTNSILAPSISYNALIYTTGTIRWFYYPTDDLTFTLVPSYSTNVNRNLKVELNYLPKKRDRLTLETLFYPKRTIFERFFGIGPGTGQNAETSFTRTGFDLTARPGWNLTEYINLGPRLSLSRWMVENIGIPSRPLTRERFPKTPGMAGSTVFAEGLSLRIDHRPQREYSTKGWSANLYSGYHHGLSRSPDFGKFSAESTLLWEELSWLNGAARAYWTYIAGNANVPFLEQATLGGEYRFRGFNGGRFYGRGAWLIETEQRIAFLKTHIYGVQAEWRVDPFISVGQVYDHFEEIIKHTRIAGGLGFRAWVKPNVLGRVDVGYGREGAKIYVELGYPY